MRRCDQRTEWGRCEQPAAAVAEGFVRKALCVFHLRWWGALEDPDLAYHRKIVLGFLQPAETYMTPEQMRTTLHGRVHDDGRPMDAFASDDQIDPTLSD